MLFGDLIFYIQDIMITFIVPLRSPLATNNWELTSELCNGTLLSMVRQTSQSFRTLVVCNEPPLRMISNKNIIPIVDDFPVPSDRKEMMDDKALKISRGFSELQNIRTDHVMIVDADDRLSKHLVEYVADKKSVTGWYFSSGYVYPLKSRFIFRQTDFHLRCGTSHVIQYRYHNNILRSGGHHKLEMFMRDNGCPLEDLPFAGACYVTDTGQNCSNVSMLRWQGKLHYINKIRNVKYLSKGIKDEFSLI